MRTSSRRWFGAGLCLASAWLAATSALQGQTVIDWVPTTSGTYNYNNINNWTGLNVPNTTSESARFNNAGNFDVTFSSGATTTIHDLLVNNGNLRFASGGAVFSTFNIDDDAFIQGGNLTLSRSAGAGNVNLNVADLLQVASGSTFRSEQGADVTAGRLLIGAANAAGGTVVFDGAGTTLAVTSAGVGLGASGGTGSLTFQNGSTGNSIVGFLNLVDNSSVAGSSGILTVSSGSTLQTQSIRVGHSNSASAFQEAYLHVSGAGSALTQTGAATLTIGDDINPNVWSEVGVFNNGQFTSGTGETLIRNGGWLRVESGTFIANGNISQSSGRIYLINTTGTIPSIDGNAISIGDDTGTHDAKFFVTGTGNHNVLARGLHPITFFADADVEVSTGATLNLVRSAIFNSVNGTLNAGFGGGGTIILNGTDNRVNERTTINMPTGRFDLDGTGIGAQTLTLAGADADLILNVAGINSISTPGNGFGKSNPDGPDRIVLHQFSDLVVNLTDPAAAWTLNPSAVLDIQAAGGGVAGAGIHGSDFIMAGTANVSGDSRWDARTEIAGTVNIAAGGKLTLAGGPFEYWARRNRLAGGTINGPGTLNVAAFHALDGFGTINAPIDGFGNIAAVDGLLTIAGPIINSWFTAGENGTLRIEYDWNTVVADLGVNNGVVEGGVITNDSFIYGLGRVTTPVINNNIIHAYDGRGIDQSPTLVLEDSASDWDGATNTGQLIGGAVIILPDIGIYPGHLELRDNALFPFQGEVVVNPNSSVFANGFELKFEPNAKLTFNADPNGDSRYRSTHATRIGGTTVVAQGVATLEIQGATTFESTSTTTLSGNLRLDNPLTLIQAGAAFTGDGGLIVPAGRQLSLNHGAVVGVKVTNDGTLTIAGNSIGQAEIAALEQLPNRALRIDLAGTLPAQFDRLTVAGLADLDGVLEVSLSGGFSLSMNDEFTFLAAGNLSGAFTSIAPQNFALAPDLALDLVYSAQDVTLRVVPALPGDYNLNGVVDAADYVLFRKYQGTSSMLPNDSIGGTIGAAQYDQWRAKFGAAAGGGSGTSTNAAVPEPATLALLIFAAAGWCLQRGPATA